MYKKTAVFMFCLLFMINLNITIAAGTTMTGYAGIDFVQTPAGGENGNSGGSTWNKDTTNTGPGPGYVSIVDAEVPGNSLGDLPKTGGNLLYIEILLLTGILLLLTSEENRDKIPQC